VPHQRLPYPAEAKLHYPQASFATCCLE
jgi:hypothetical protein